LFVIAYLTREMLFIGFSGLGGILGGITDPSAAATADI
jgi:hypothetical protein